MTIRVRLTRTRVILLGAITALAAGGVAYAAIPGPNGVIHGCYDNKGALSVIDSSTSCHPNQTALNWNQTGPTGATGATGPAGPPAGRAAFALTTLDSTGYVGQSPSVTVGTDGFGLISYYDATNADLKVAHCTNAACTAATTTTLDSTGVGGSTSVTVGTDGFGLISYYDATSADLKVAHCALTGCPAYAQNR